MGDIKISPKRYNLLIAQLTCDGAFCSLFQSVQYSPPNHFLWKGQLRVSREFCSFRLCVVSVWLSYREEDTRAGWQIHPGVMKCPDCLNTFPSLLYPPGRLNVFRLPCYSRSNEQWKWLWEVCLGYKVSSLRHGELLSKTVLSSWQFPLPGFYLRAGTMCFLLWGGTGLGCLFKSSWLPYSTPSSCWKTQFNRRLSALMCPADLVTKNKRTVVSCWRCQGEPRRGGWMECVILFLKAIPKYL